MIRAVISLTSSVSTRSQVCSSCCFFFFLNSRLSLSVCLSVCLPVSLSGRVFTVVVSPFWGFGFDCQSRPAWLGFSILPRSVKWTAISKQWVLAAEDCECEPQVMEERWPRVLDICYVQTHFTCGLAAIETDMSTAPQIILVLNNSLSVRNLLLHLVTQFVEL